MTLSIVVMFDKKSKWI